LLGSGQVVHALEAAWSAVHEALPPFWRVGPVTFDPGILRADGHMGAYSVTARGPHPGRGKVPQTVTGTGASEIEALRALDARLRGREDAGGNVEALRARLRLAYVQGAEEWTLDNLGRWMATSELLGIIGRFQR